MIICHNRLLMNAQYIRPFPILHQLHTNIILSNFYIKRTNQKFFSLGRPFDYFSYRKWLQVVNILKTEVAKERARSNFQQNLHLNRSKWKRQNKKNTHEKSRGTEETMTLTLSSPLDPGGPNATTGSFTSLRRFAPTLVFSRGGSSDLSSFLLLCTIVSDLLPNLLGIWTLFLFFFYHTEVTTNFRTVVLTGFYNLNKHAINSAFFIVSIKFYHGVIDFDSICFPLT